MDLILFRSFEEKAEVEAWVKEQFEVEDMLDGIQR